MVKCADFVGKTCLTECPTPIYCEVCDFNLGCDNCLLVEECSKRLFKVLTKKLRRTIWGCLHE